MGHVNRADAVGAVAQRIEPPQQRLAPLLGDELHEVGRARGQNLIALRAARRIQGCGKRTIPLAHRLAGCREIEHDAFAGTLGDEEAARRQGRDRHGGREARVRDRPHDVQVAVEGDEAAAVGVGGPGEVRDSGGGGAAEEQQGEFAGGRAAGRDGGDGQRGRYPQRTAHQVAAAIVLISIVCIPPAMRCVPVTFTLPSANGSSREFCGSPGFELTGM